jgi:ABC-type uncharacterized transport system substrate-binding protein
LTLSSEPALSTDEDYCERNNWDGRQCMIATTGITPGAFAANAATDTIPNVFGVGEDAVALGPVTSLAHPRTNATGINFFASETNTKRLAYLLSYFLPSQREMVGNTRATVLSR